MAKFLDNMLSLVIYTVIFALLLWIFNPDFTLRQLFGIGAILGFFAGIINNLERVIREVHKNEGQSF